MKILIIPNNMTNNCFGVRNELPAEFLGKLGYEVKIENGFKGYNHPEYGKVLDPGLIDWADTVVFNRHYDVPMGTIKNLIVYAKEHGKKVIYETDDLLEALNFSNPMYESLLNHVSQVRMMAGLADVCTTTGEGLKEELLKYNPNVQILPNCVDPEKWKLRKGKNKKVKVGYAGGSSHNEDLFLIIDVVRELQKEIDFEFVIFGLVPQPWNEVMKNLREKHKEQMEEKPGAKPAEWYAKMVELDDKLADIKWKHQPFVPKEEYPAKMAEMNLDIGLCPIVDNRFNRCKSAIKFYEYTMTGTACLASKIPPYELEVSYTAKNKHGNWYNKLKTLIINNQLREAITKEQREWVLENRDIRKNIHLWEQAYTKQYGKFHQD